MDINWEDYIARQLYICEQTVKDHLQDVYRNVGVRSRTALIAKMLGTSSEMATEGGDRRR